MIKISLNLESSCGVKTKIIAVDFSKGSEIYDNIKENIKSLDVGILVNNVGSNQEFPDIFDNLSEEEIWKIINVNIGAVTQMSRMVIPLMKKNRRGVIVNVSSGTEAQPLPLMIVYSSSKVFVKNFSLGMT